MKVTVKNMELTASRNDEPMVLVTFLSNDGSETVFNQVVTQGFQIHIVNELLRKMVSEAKNAPEIEFKNYKQYNDLIDTIFSIISGCAFNLTVHDGIRDGFYTYHLQVA